MESIEHLLTLISDSIGLEREPVALCLLLLAGLTLHFALAMLLRRARRLAAGELALKASQSAMLHTGAKGYLNTAPAQRKLRESYFIAIVTPAIKHLRKELDVMEAAA